MRIVALLAVLGSLSACVSASASSFVNRAELPTGYEAEPILIWFPVEDLSIRAASERRFVEEVSRLGSSALAGADVLFPDRSYTPDEILAAAQDAGATTLLAVSVSSANQAQTPPTGIATCIRTDAQGRCLQTVTSAISPQSIPGKVVFQFGLFDLDRDVGLWRATVETKNNAGAARAWIDLATKAMEEAVKQLQEDGLLTPAEGAEK